MTRERAWLEEKRGAWGIRYRHPTERRPDGEPRKPFAMIDGGNGRRVKSEAEARRFLEAFIERLPPEAGAPKPVAGVPMPVRLTIGKVALAWHADHPDNDTRDGYLATVRDAYGPDGLEIDFPDQLSLDRIDAYRKKKVRGHEVPLSYLRSILGWAVKKRLIPALDDAVMAEMTRPPTAEADVRVMTREEYDLTMSFFKKRGPHYHAIAHCLSTYGWRPKTACRLKVGDVNLKQLEITLRVKQVKGKKRTKRHTLLPSTVPLLQAITVDRHPDEPLFLHHTKEGGWAGWKYGESADQLINFYVANVQRFAPDCGGMYAWKRWAIESMALGRAPWPKPMTDIKAMMDFTGHLDPAMLLRYRKNSPAVQREALGLPRAEDMEEVVVEDAESYVDHGGVAVVRPVVWGGVDATQGLAEVGEAGSIVASFTCKLGAF